MKSKSVRLCAPVIAFTAATLYALAPDAQARVAAESVSAAANCQGICVLGVRAATHPGFDRFVIDLGDGPIPAWTESIQTEPLTCCGDETNEHVIPVTGKSYLKIHLSPASSFDFKSQTPLYSSPRHSTFNFKSLKGQGLTGTVDPEAREFRIGLALGGHSSYKIYKLAGPNRLVVDINH
ncbi:hypothetical protein ACFYYM_40475 [Streptomyces erythrochromogenes]|uniref:AMIN-like domain-containing (lipo)protein n=1 Tax=Streptomyces erythrochromogenes TaxID=285574 RepID=UPI003689FB56